MSKVYKFATLNLNGETWNLNNKIPRLPEDLFNVEQIKSKLTEKVKNGLENLLKPQIYDVIAVQELVYIKKYHDYIKETIEKCGYILKEPKKLIPNTHFTVAYIIKKQYEENITSSTELCKENNRNFQLTVTISGVDFTFVNLHIKPGNQQKITKELKSMDVNKNIILLGDFNAYTKEQNEEGTASKNSIIISELIEAGYMYQGKDTQYTYCSNGKWRKLDHIFTSKGFNKIDNETKVTVNLLNTVNFYSNGNGFTDHSMMIMEFEK